MKKAFILAVLLLYTPTMAANDLRVRLNAKDFANVIQEPSLEKAIDALKRGDFVAAKERLVSYKSKNQIERARFLLGLTCMKLMDWMCAELVLDGLERLVPVIADRILFMRAQALAELGRIEDALVALEGVKKTSSSGIAALRLKSDLLMRLNRSQEAAAALDEIVKSGRRDIATIESLAKTLELLGRKQEAIELVRKVYLSATTGRSAIRRLLSMLGVEMTPSPQEILEGASALLDAHANEEALRAARALQTHNDKAVRCGALMIEGAALSKLRRYSEALNAFRKAMDCGDLVDQAKVLFNAARAAFRAGDRAEGERLATRLAGESPSSSLNDDLSVVRARIALSRSEHEKAIAILEESLRRWPDGDMANESRWILAWTLFKQKKYPAALARLRDGAKNATQDMSYGSRFYYWAGRTLEMMGKHREALREFETCVRDYPMTYYSFLALNRIAHSKKVSLKGALNKLKRDTKDIGPYLTVEASALKTEGIGGALWLLQNGLDELAIEELGSSGVDTSPDVKWITAAILDAVEAFSRSHRLASSVLENIRFWPDEDRLGYFRLAYPRPFETLVMKAAKESGVDPALIWAVMREESAFVTGIESRANAIGLMQLILPTARAMAKKLNLEATPQTLRQPEVNIRLGTRYLAELQKRFGSLLLAIPSYNAGEGAIAKWRKTNPDTSLDIFVEDIGAQETRDYARKVFESFAIYHFLYAKEEDRFVHIHF